MAVGYPIPEAMTVLGSIQLLFNYLNQTGLKIFTNNPGPNDEHYKDIILNLANGNYQVRSVRDVINTLIEQLPILKSYLPIGITQIIVSDTTATVTTGSVTNGQMPHNYSVGNKVIISNSAISGLNTPQNTVTTILTTPDAYTFTYAVISGTSNDPNSAASVQCYSSI